jgi:hypothetical protein
MSGMFQNAASFNQPTGDWDVRNVMDMSFMFQGASAFKQAIARWDNTCFDSSFRAQKTLPRVYLKWEFHQKALAMCQINVSITAPNGQRVVGVVM